SDSDISSSENKEWTRVGKRRNNQRKRSGKQINSPDKNGKRGAFSLKQENSRGVLPAVHHRKDADVQPAGSAKFQLGRPVSSLGDQVGYLAPRLSPTTQASLLIHAVESLGKSGLG
ncbi:hypothetical protein U1Q18_032669, partial [Sarracenia purpurea var. burkii]